MKMNKLPVNVQLKILDSLFTKDAIKCRLVCRTWHDLVDQFVLDELNLFFSERQHTEFFDLRNCLSNLNKSLSFPEHVFTRLVIENEQFYRLFRNVKKFFFKQDSAWMGRKPNLEKLISMNPLEYSALVIIEGSYTKKIIFFIDEFNFQIPSRTWYI